MNEKERPVAVTIICGFLIVLGTITFISLSILLVASNPTFKGLTPTNLFTSNILYIADIHLFILVICGIAMWKRQNWGRMIYVIATIIDILIHIAFSPSKPMHISGIILFLVFVFYLFRPETNKYFKNSKDA